MANLDSYDDPERDMIWEFLDDALNEENIFGGERIFIEEVADRIIEGFEFDTFNVTSAYLHGLEETVEARYMMANSFIYSAFHCMGKNSSQQSLTPGAPNTEYLDIARRIMIDETQFTSNSHSEALHEMLFYLENFDMINRIIGHVVNRAVELYNSDSIMYTLGYDPTGLMPAPLEMCFPRGESHLTLEQVDFETGLLHLGYESNPDFNTLNSIRMFKEHENLAFKLKNSFFGYVAPILDNDEIAQINLWPFFSFALETVGYSQYLLAHQLRMQEVKSFSGIDNPILPHSERDDKLSSTLRFSSIAEILNRTYLLREDDGISDIAIDTKLIFNSLIRKLSDEFIGLLVHNNYDCQFNLEDMDKLEELANVYGLLVDYGLGKSELM